MPISFGNPALLFGAAAAALPLIIHFLSRRRVRRRQFSDLRFLTEVRAHRSRSLGLRRWLLLLLRMLALLLIALAAAAPRWGGLAGGGGRAVLCIIDTSASMSTQQEGGTRLDAAVAACAGMIDALPSGASVQIVTAGDGAAPLFDDWLPAGAGAVDGLETVRQAYGVFDLAEALRVAARQVETAPQARVEVVVISDLQASRSADLAAAASRLAGAGSVRVLVRRVGDEGTGGGVRTVTLPGRVLLAGERITVAATAVTDRAGEVFALTLDGETVAEAVAAGPPGGSVPLEFAVTVPGPGLHRGSVRKTSDAFPADDERPFVLAVPDEIAVLVAHGPDRPGADPTGRGGWRVVAAALAPDGEGDLFRVRTLPADRLTTAAVDAAALTILVDPGTPGRQALAGLRSELETGGALFVLVGDPTQAADLANTWQPLLGLPPGAEFETSDTDRHAAVTASDHPVFAGLPADALRTLEDVGWRRWFQVAEGQGTTLLAMAAGDDPVLQAGTRFGGRWALLTAHLQPDASDLPGSSMILPLLRRLGTWLARPRLLAAVAEVRVGEPLTLEPLAPAATDPRLAATFADPAALMVAGPAEGSRRGAILSWRGDTPLLAGGPATAPGFATFLAGTDTVGLAACGLDPAESGLDRQDPAPWGAELAAAGLTYAGDLTSTLAADFLGAVGGRPLAPWIFGLAALLLALELWIGRGAAPENRPTGG
ncbi:MAG: VWA domain-containing protein [bacterium]|nr:VWA domain-containing protein [bacterium]